MTKPFFSIIIPSLNEEKYLPHLLSDLADQSFQDFEVIVVDGHSDDNTVKTAKTFSRRLSLKIVNSSRRHVCVQRNLGAKSAKADTFIFMDADNRLPPYFLQGIKYRLESSPADIATCWLQSDHDSTKDKNISLAINYAHELLKNSKAPIMMESLVISSHQAFHKIGGFDENVNLGEGTFFTKQALTNHFTYSVYRDPIYTYSFRRLRKYGTLNITGRLAQNELAKLLDIPLSRARISKLYPMKGGSLFTTSTKKRNRFTNQVQHLLNSLRSPETFKQSLQKYLSDYPQQNQPS